MSDPYKYIDPDYTYIDPHTGVLRNLQGVNDPEDYIFFEGGMVVKRLGELSYNPIQITGIESLFEIHKFLFQDIFSWAGKRRLVEIAKDGKQFFPTTRFETAFRYIDRTIADYRKIPAENKKHIAEKLAQILDDVNYLHPFR